MDKKVIVSFVISAYNEEATLGQVLDMVKSAVLPTGVEREIIAIDNGSHDRTAGIIKNSPDVRMISLSPNRGKGGALKVGFAEATGDILMIQDADMEYDAADYPALLEPILSGCTEMVVGRRPLSVIPFSEGVRNVQHILPYFGNKIVMKYFINWLYGDSASDYACAYKVFTKKLVDSIVVKANGFDYEFELVCKAMRKGVPLIEVPVRYQPRSYEEGKKIRTMDGIKILRTALRSRFF